MREKIIEILQKDDFVSGEFIAESLGVSRTAVWKHIKQLQKLGYNVECVKNRGYRLVSRPDIPISEEVKNGLNTKVVGCNILYFESIDSTNIYGKKLAEKQVDEGAVIVSEMQTLGRGRKNRFWDSPKSGLWFSIVLYPNIPPYSGMIITMAVSASIAQAVKDVVGVECVIKWPNDLLIKNKKVCGVLTELDAELDRINYTVVGIGINVNNSIKKDLQDIATSLRFENDNKHVSRVDLLRSILQNLDENYYYVKKGNYQFIRDLWKSYANIIGRSIKVENDDDSIIGVVVDIDDSGCLVLDTDQGVVKIVSGDVTYL